MTATRSTYTLAAGPVTLTATFFSPVDPASLMRQCVPMSYITVTAAARDGGGHRVSVYLDISAEWAHGYDTKKVSWRQQAVGGLNVLTVTPASPEVLAEHRDQASWGTVVWATDDVAGLTWQAGHGIIVRGNGAAGPLPGTSDPRQPRAINDDWPVLGFRRDLGTVTASGGAELVVCIGHVRHPAVSYLGTPLPSLWRNYWSSWQEMLGWFRADLPAARRVCAATDEAVRHWAGQQLGAGSAVARQYAAITALALRQAYGGTELVRARSGAPWAFLKEISSDGNVSTLDVLFPAFPAYLQLAPRYLELLLAPVFDYVENHDYPRPWAPHDLGASYPNVSGHLDGSREEDMPVEETGNILLLASAAASRMPAEQAARYARAHYRILRRWARYLLSQAPSYAGTQNQTDDFTGVIAKSVNLNLKGIVALGAFSHIAGHAGNGADRAAYAAAARHLIGRWAGLGRDARAPHLDLAYGDTGTYSLKYNAFPDRLLNINLVRPEIQASEAAWYVASAHRYGVPLDTRHAYTKGDWEMLTAAFLAAQPRARNLLISGLYRFLDASPSRVPFSDWYDTVTVTRRGFRNRPVVGGAFAIDTLRYAPNSLTGYWPCDFYEARDASGNGADLILSGGAACAASGPGHALSLHRAGAHARTARPVVRTDASFTVAARVRLAAASGVHTAVSQDGASVSGFALQFSAADRAWALAMPGADSPHSTVTRAVAAATPAPGTWVHLACVRDADAGRLLLYVDGGLSGRADYSAAWQASGGLQVGRGLRAGRPADYFEGEVGEVRTYGRALPAAEVAAAAGLPGGLLASYALDEGSGPVAADQAGGHVLRLRGARWCDGYSGHGLAFAGRSAAVAAGFLDTGADFTVSAWVLLGDTGGRHVAISQDGAAVSGFSLEYSAAGDAWAFAMPPADSASVSPARAVAPLPPRTGGWQHLVGVHDAAARRLRLYVDGRLAGEAACGPAWRAGGAFVLGRGLASWRSGRAGWFRGRIDQVRAWSRALSDADVAALV